MSVLDRCGLRINPFDPVASGPPVDGPPLAPPPVEQPLHDRIAAQRDTAGTKLTVIVGEYSSGKTYRLRWLEDTVFPSLTGRTQRTGTCAMETGTGSCASEHLAKEPAG